jgi:hypothetical protein
MCRNYKVLVTVTKSFAFLLVGPCAFLMFLGYFVVAEAGCNLYLHAINIFPLSNKKVIFLCKYLACFSRQIKIPNVCAVDI